MKQSSDLIRVSFRLQPVAWHNHGWERLWAKELAPSRYQLRNSPYYAYGVSYEDIVSAVRDDAGELVYAGVTLRGGHSTYRIMLKCERTSREFEQQWARLQNIGCTYESRDKLLAVDVPPKADIFGAYKLLQEGEQVGLWTFEEAHCGHAV